MLEFWERLGLRDKEKRRVWQLCGLLIFGMVLMGASAGFGGGDLRPVMSGAVGNINNEIYSDTVVAPQESQSPEAELEQKLSAILSRIEGAGEVRVSLTFAKSAQTEYAVNASTTLRSTQENTEGGQTRSTTEETSSGSLVMSESGGRGEPVAVQESMPQVQGVLVVAAGGDKPQVCAQISQALQNLLALPAHKIVICQAGV